MHVLNKHAIMCIVNVISVSRHTEESCVSVWSGKFSLSRTLSRRSRSSSHSSSQSHTVGRENTVTDREPHDQTYPQTHRAHNPSEPQRTGRTGKTRSRTTRCQSAATQKRPPPANPTLLPSWAPADLHPMTTLWFKNTAGNPGVSWDTYAGGVATQSSTGTVALKSHKSHKSAA